MTGRKFSPLRCLKVVGALAVGASVGLRPGVQKVHDETLGAAPVPSQALLQQHKGLCHHGNVHVREWFGRFGNNLKQLTNAMVLAKWSHSHVVVLPGLPAGSTQEQPMKDLLAIDKKISVKVEKGENWYTKTFTCSCDETDDDVRFHFDTTCVAKNPEMQAAAFNLARRKVMMDLFWPKVHQEYADCAQPDDFTLTIHGRYGDVAPGHWNDAHPQGHLYPCEFYDHLIDTHKLKKVIFLLQEKDVKTHPCGLTLHKRKDIGFEYVTSLPGAVCNVVKATNLVIPLSTFSQSLVYGTQNAKRVFSVQDHTHYGIQPTPAEQCQQGSPEFFEYVIEGFTTNHTKKEKWEYMLSKGLSFNVTTHGCLF